MAEKKATKARSACRDAVAAFREARAHVLFNLNVGPGDDRELLLPTVKALMRACGDAVHGPDAHAFAEAAVGLRSILADIEAEAAFAPPWSESAFNNAFSGEQVDRCTAIVDRVDAILGRVAGAKAKEERDPPRNARIDEIDKNLIEKLRTERRAMGPTELARLAGVHLEDSVLRKRLRRLADPDGLYKIRRGSRRYWHPSIEAKK